MIRQQRAYREPRSVCVSTRSVIRTRQLQDMPSAAPSTCRVRHGRAVAVVATVGGGRGRDPIANGGCPPSPVRAGGPGRLVLDDSRKIAMGTVRSQADDDYDSDGWVSLVGRVSRVRCRWRDWASVVEPGHRRAGALCRPCRTRIRPAIRRRWSTSPTSRDGAAAAPTVRRTMTRTPTWRSVCPFVWNPGLITPDSGSLCTPQSVYRHWMVPESLWTMSCPQHGRRAWPGSRMPYFDTC